MNHIALFLKSTCCRYIFAPALLLFLISPANFPLSASEKQEAVNVGMVALLANPPKYQGKIIQTTGFMCLEFEGNALYLHEEDFRYNNLKNALWLGVSPAQKIQFKALNLKHVIIEGTFNVNGPSQYGGAINDITDIKNWPARADIPAPPELAPPACSFGHK